MSVLSRARPGRLARLRGSVRLLFTQAAPTSRPALEAGQLPLSAGTCQEWPLPAGDFHARGPTGLPLSLRRQYHGLASTSIKMRDARTITEEGLSDSDEGGEEKGAPKEERVRVLEAALSHVPKLGWTEAALAEGAHDCHLSPAVLGILPRKEADLVEYFMEKCREDLAKELERRREELAELPLKERTVAAVRARLEMQAPHASTWPQALSVQARPANAAASLRQRAELMDTIWAAVGDAGTQVERYAKRLLLAGAYSTSELYMLTDFSPGFHDTWSFLERQVEGVLEMRKSAREAGQAAFAIGTGISNTLSSLFKGQPPGSRSF